MSLIAAHAYALDGSLRADSTYVDNIYYDEAYTDPLRV